MTITDTCDECGAAFEVADADALGDAWIAHVRADHPGWPYSDVSIRNYAEAALRLERPTERLEAVGEVEVHPVTEDRLDDWLAFFDRDAFADNRAWADCYCLEPHVHPKNGSPEDGQEKTWHQKRDAMIELLRSGRSFGYLAYVDGKVGGWVNASRRSEYSLYRCGEGTAPADDDVVGVSCFVIAAPYRRHGLAAHLLDRVVADADDRGVSWVEGYPFKKIGDDGGNFRGLRSMFDHRGFEAVEEAERHVVVRRPAR